MSDTFVGVDIAKAEFIRACRPDGVCLTTHHGLARSGVPALVEAIAPHIVVMNNGPRKGGSVEVWDTLNLKFKI